MMVAPACEDFLLFSNANATPPLQDYAFIFLQDYALITPHYQYKIVISPSESWRNTLGLVRKYILARVLMEADGDVEPGLGEQIRRGTHLHRRLSAT